LPARPHRYPVTTRPPTSVLGAVTTAWVRAAVSLVWAGPSALAAGLGQQCQAEGQKPGQHYAADFHLFKFLL
jgi:hypothetical protein